MDVVKTGRLTEAPFAAESAAPASLLSDNQKGDKAWDRLKTTCCGGLLQVTSAEIDGSMVSLHSKLQENVVDTTPQHHKREDDSTEESSGSLDATIKQGTKTPTHGRYVKGDAKGWYPMILCRVTLGRIYYCANSESGVEVYQRWILGNDSPQDPKHFHRPAWGPNTVIKIIKNVFWGGEPGCSGVLVDISRAGWIYCHSKNAWFTNALSRWAIQTSQLNTTCLGQRYPSSFCSCLEIQRDAWT